MCRTRAVPPLPVYDVDARYRGSRRIGWGVAGEQTPWGEVVVIAGLQLVPLVGGTIATLASKSYEMDRQRVAELAERTRELVGDDELLVRRLQENKPLLDMLRDAAKSAARTSSRQKRRTMARVVANAVLDDVEINESAALLAALIRLDAPHFHYLGLIAGGQGQLGLYEIPEIPEPYRSALDREGMVTSTWDGGDATGDHAGNWPNGLTAFGAQLVHWLEDSAEST